MLSNACVVEDLGMDPNWLSPIFFNIGGRTFSSTTNSSAIWDKTGVNNIGHRSLLAIFAGLCFGIGTISAVLQDGGRRPSLKEQVKIYLTGPPEDRHSLSLAMLGCHQGKRLSWS